MSSSSALLLGLSAALAAVWGLDQQPQWPTDFSGYAACIENGNDFAALRGHTGVGTQGGAMDHTAICGATAGALTSWKMSPVERECEVILPPEVTLMVAVSGVQAEKTGAARAAYNAVSQRAARALQAWNLMRQRHDLTLSAAVAAGAVPTDFTDADLGLRVEQFIQESNVIIPAATTALRHGDLALFGKIAADSQALSASHLRNQVPETIALADLAKRHGAHAASAFGAGFGGAVWALVDRRQLDAFSKTWLAAYQRSFPNRVAHMYPIEPGPAMARLP